MSLDSNMEPNSSLGQAVAILKTISNVSWEESRIYGSIQVTPSLKTFAEDYYDTFEIELEDETGSLIDLSKIDSYSHLQIKFLPPRTNRSFLAKDFDDLLTHFNFHLTLCDEFYIHDQDIYFPDSNCTNKQLKAYQKIIELLKTLDLVSDHTQQKPTYCQILLTSKEKIFIPM